MLPRSDSDIIPPPSAGGHGMVLTSILKKYPSMQGVLFDPEHVIAGVVPRLREQGLAARCRTVSGDFFVSVPEGGDAYIMKHIIHAHHS